MPVVFAIHRLNDVTPSARRQLNERPGIRKLGFLLTYSPPKKENFVSGIFQPTTI